MSVDFEEKDFLPPTTNRYYADKPPSFITRIFMALGLGSSPDVAQWFILGVAIIFFVVAGLILIL